MDPHGLRNARSFQDAKILFHEEIKRIEREELIDPSVRLESWIISPTRRADLEHWSDKGNPQAFLEHHITFMYDDPEIYISQMLEFEPVNV